MSAPAPKFPQWFCAQIGAREHYAVPQVLHQSGQLATLFTDFWAGPITRQLAQKTNSTIGRSLATRFHPGLADARVVSWNVRSLLEELSRRRPQKNNQSGSPYFGFIEAGKKFAHRVQKKMQRQADRDSRSIFFAYDTGALEALEWCREHQTRCIVNQMDPNRVEVNLVQAEEKQWPGWALQALQVPEAYFVRREQEWATADCVVVNSEFSRQALLQQGVSADKLVVIPLCYEAGEQNRKSEIGNRKSDEPLRVLFLGQVLLRKGIQYLLAAARQLEHENIHFDIVGPIGISPEAVATAPGNVTFHGRTGRGQAAAWYQQAQVFVLPTLSDGFAITQLEAMAHGLPVVTTPCCGEVVSEGVDGFIVPPRDAAALVKTFQRYLTEPELLKSQSAAALIKARQFTRERLAENLKRLAAVG